MFLKLKDDMCACIIALESCRTKQERYQLSHPLPYLERHPSPYLATYLHT